MKNQLKLNLQSQQETEKIISELNQHDLVGEIIIPNEIIDGADDKLHDFLMNVELK